MKTSRTDKKMSGRRRTTIHVQAMLNPEKSSAKPKIPQLTKKVSPEFLTEDHKEIFKTVSYQTDINVDDVEKYALNCPNGTTILKKYSENTEATLMFYHNKESLFEIKTESGEKVSIPLILTGGQTHTLNGSCLYFIKEKDKPLNFGRFHVNCNDKDSMRTAISTPLRSVFLPLIERGENWSHDKLDGETKKRNCLDDFHHFLSYIDSVEDSFRHIVKFSDSVEIDLSGVKTSHDIQKFILFDEKVALVENLMVNWMKKFDEVIAESNLIRLEPEDTGPLAELEYWQSMSCKFSSVAEFVKTSKFETVLKILKASHSKLTRLWKEQEKPLFTKVYEANDNVKYLTKVKDACKVFYKTDLEEIKKSIPYLINKMQMITLVSRYYHTPEHLTSFFAKITNQIVIACKNYISDSGRQEFLQMDPAIAQKKVKICLGLYFLYKTHMGTSKRHIVEDSQRTFKLHQVPVMATFDSFRKRLDLLLNVLDTFEELSVLQESYIEGISEFASKFTSIVNTMKMKPYDFLDHRSQDFDNDYKEFDCQISDLKENLQKFVDSQFDNISSAKRAIMLLERFQNLKIPKLDTTRQHVKIFRIFEKELVVIRRVYQKNKDDPSHTGATVYYSKKILWANDLIMKINGPLEKLRPFLHLLPKVQETKLLHVCETLAGELVQYKHNEHTAYCEAITQCFNEMNQSIVLEIEMPKYTGAIEWIINFPDTLFTMIADTRTMLAIPMTVPNEAKLLMHNSEKLMATKCALRDLIIRFRDTQRSIPDIFRPLISPHIIRVDNAICAGGTYLTWLTGLMDQYIKNIRTSFSELEWVLQRVTDLKCNILDDVLKDIGSFSFFRPPETSLSPVNFPDYVEERCKSVAENLAHKLRVYDKYVNIIVDFLLEEAREAHAHFLKSKILRVALLKDKNLRSDYDTKYLVPQNKFTPECEILIEHFEVALVKAVAKCRMQTLIALADVFQYVGYVEPFIKKTEMSKNSKRLKVGFLSSLVIEGFSLTINPSIDILQSALNESVNVIQETITYVLNNREKELEKVRPPKKAEPGELRLTFEKRVEEYSDTQRHTSFLMTGAKSVMPLVTKVFKICLVHKHLWSGDNDTYIKEFVTATGMPHIYKLKCKLQTYKDLENTISAMPYSFSIPGIELLTDSLKRALLLHVNKWFKRCGYYIETKYSDKLREVSYFIHDKLEKFSFPILELSDVQRAMKVKDELEEKSYEIDISIQPINDAFDLLLKNRLFVDPSDIEMAKNLEGSFEMLKKKEMEVFHYMHDNQEKYLEVLNNFVEAFKADIKKFDEDYIESGPMAPKITLEEANKRFNFFKDRFSDLCTRYESNRYGEELFGLPLTEYPTIGRGEKDLDLLQKFFSLFDLLAEKIESYLDCKWQEIKFQVMIDELTELDNKCEELPTECKQWAHFKELRQRIEDFKEKCLLLMSLKDEDNVYNEGILHWISDKDQSLWTLRTIMKVPLLEFKINVKISEHVNQNLANEVQQQVEIISSSTDDIVNIGGPIQENPPDL